MSLGIVIKGPEGLVLAAESRITLAADGPEGYPILVNFDNATKLLSFSKPNNNIGVVTYGLAALGLRAANSFIPEFEASLPEDKQLTTQKFSEKLSDFFLNQWDEEEMPPVEEYDGPNMTFVVAGFDHGDAYGRVFSIDIPQRPKPVEQTKDGEFGITWGGQREYVDRIIQGYDHRLINLLKSKDLLSSELDESLLALQMPIPLDAMALQDCVDLALFFVRTTINAQNLSFGIRGCGGEIDVAVITRGEPLQFIQKKQITGERK